jgi:hypothetical protein
MITDYNNFKEVIEILNRNNVQYLILRNYDNLLSPNLYQDGHGDIDMLVRNHKEVVDLIGAKPWNLKYKTKYGDGTHFYITIKDKRVSLDLREVGDGYYCTLWEKNMLKKRVLYNGFYIMDEENLFFSLAYHAILQKRFFSNEYCVCLNRMGEKLGLLITYYDESDFIQTLEVYMRNNGYMYTLCNDFTVPLRTKLIDKNLLHTTFHLWFIHFKFDAKVAFIEFIVMIKHRLHL